MNARPKPATVDLGDGDTLALHHHSDDYTVVRFHGSNPNVQMSSACVPTADLRDALYEVAPVADVDPGPILDSLAEAHGEIHELRERLAEQKSRPADPLMTDQDALRSAWAAYRKKYQPRQPLREYEAFTAGWREHTKWDADKGGTDPRVTALADVLGGFLVPDEHNGSPVQLARVLVARGVTVSTEEESER